MSFKIHYPKSFDTCSYGEVTDQMFNKEVEEFLEGNPDYEFHSIVPIIGMIFKRKLLTKDNECI